LPGSAGVLAGCGLRHGLWLGLEELPDVAASTAQMTSSSSSLMMFDWPDHRPDIFPALITMPRSASRRGSWLGDLITIENRLQGS
jgi:hypothetical protein